MSPDSISTLELADTDHAIQVADRVWWVGHRQENDIFQCHVYLIEQGDQSILLDPGSMLTFRHTLRKIEDEGIARQWPPLDQEMELVPSRSSPQMQQAERN